ncbi:DUF4386 family protein [Aeromicrobium terrae]|uniref:DUF4386 family protein n=1 Tax=Aeromicrobium terrae TaxID=2498846 RepID=A0A5C8NFQ8_9ACTN|nr:DUF4386 family protein [Aeromicrobium terrae]TXL56606.1 hypothetical protein FHP06_15220 [Aeromicrobium terrae]
MKDTALFRRDVAALGLLLNAVLSAVSVMLAPAFPSGAAARLTAIDDGGAAAATSAALFVAAQLPLVAGVLGIAHLLRERSPALSNLGGSLGIVGTFGHAVFGGISLTYVVMASHPDDRAQYATLVDRIESTPIMLFAMLGLVGTVLGMLLLSIALFRTRVVPRWMPVVVWLFIVVEFVGTGLSDSASYLSAVLVVLAFGAIAREIHRTPRDAWSAPRLRQPSSV